MKLYYEDNWCALYHGDCMDVMDDIGSVDLVVTSPPYNLNKRYSSGGGTAICSKMTKKYEDWYSDDMPEQEYVKWQKDVLSKLANVCVGSIFYNHKIRYAWHNRNKHRTPSNCYHPWDIVSDFPVWSEIIWDRGSPDKPNFRYRLQHEYIYQIKKPKVSRGQSGYGSAIWRIRPDSSGHVCSFPIEIPLRCIEDCSDLGDLVLDPFCGSGTTLLAARSLKRKSIGIEREERYCEMTAQRLAEAT